MLNEGSPPHEGSTPHESSKLRSPEEGGEGDESLDYDKEKEEFLAALIAHIEKSQSDEWELGPFNHLEHRWSDIEILISPEHQWAYVCSPIDLDMTDEEKAKLYRAAGPIFRTLGAGKLRAFDFQSQFEKETEAQARKGQ